MNLTLPLCYSVYLIAYSNASMPGVTGGAGMRQWTCPTIPTQHELSLDLPCAPTLAFPDGRHYLLCFSPVADDGLWHPPTVWYVGPLDRNNDHRLTSEDFFLYLSAWMDARPSADYDGNGRVDSADFFAFNADWSIYNR